MLKTLTAGLGLAAALAFSSPVQAQASNYTPGAYTDVSDIMIEPGQFENYMDYLAGTWKAQQEFAKSKGYITGYSVLVNTYRRAGEPDLFLLTQYTKQYDVAEQLRQQKEYEAFVKSDTRALGAQSAVRGKMRKLGSQTQLQELVLK